MMNAFSLRVEVSQAMSGANKFLRMGSTLYVSPELFEAMCGAKTSEELMALLARVGVVEIPEMRLRRRITSCPMTTKFESPTFNDIRREMFADLGMPLAMPPRFLARRTVAVDLEDVVTAEEIAVAGRRRPGGD